MKKIAILIVILNFWSCQADQHQENQHQEPTHNFTVKRLLILNDKNELLMVKEASNWYTPSLIFNKRQFLKESIDSLSHAYGITTTAPELRGYFSYKYEYHPYATMRAIYQTRYTTGQIKVPSGMEAVQWMPIEEAIAKTPVKSMKQTIKKIFQSPDIVWGASFMVYREGEEHQTRMLEDFYPLFGNE